MSDFGISSCCSWCFSLTVLSAMNCTVCCLTHNFINCIAVLLSPTLYWNEMKPLLVGCSHTSVCSGGLVCQAWDILGNMPSYCFTNSQMRILNRIFSIWRLKAQPHQHWETVISFQQNAHSHWIGVWGKSKSLRMKSNFDECCAPKQQTTLTRLILSGKVIIAY